MARQAERQKAEGGEGRVIDGGGIFYKRDAGIPGPPLIARPGAP